ncbi:MAG: hypothetical protein QW331_02525, partial [Candidatus Woesearchaeota archaeon]
MKIIKLKKRGDISYSTVLVVLSLIALVVFAMVIFWPTEPLKAEIRYQTTQTIDDFDNDGVRNRYDKCPCVPGLEEADLPGCLMDQAKPIPYTSEQAAKVREGKENPCGLVTAETPSTQEQREGQSCGSLKVYTSAGNCVSKCEYCAVTGNPRISCDSKIKSTWRCNPGWTSDTCSASQTCVRGYCPGQDYCSETPGT